MPTTDGEIKFKIGEYAKDMFDGHVGKVIDVFALKGQVCVMLAIPRKNMEDLHWRYFQDELRHARAPLCATCHAEVDWVVTQSGRRMPIDRKPAENGNIYLSDGGYATYCQGDCPEGKKRYLSHFVTCPHASEHRKEGKPKRAKVDATQGALL